MFTARRQPGSRWRDELSFEELRGGGLNQPPLHSRSTRPVPIGVSTPAEHVSPSSVTSTAALIGDHASFVLSVPSYETIQRFAPVSAGSPESTLKPPSYNPRWERLPAYGNESGMPISGRRNVLGATPPSYWNGAPTMVPIAAGGGGMFFNSPFQHYRLVQQADVEEGQQRERSDRICGMSVGRADIVINLSLLALCILIWSAVVLSLNFSESRKPVQGSQGTAYPNYGQPFKY